MNERPTPETDLKIWKTATREEVVFSAVARRLERERDEARENAARLESVIKMPTTKRDQPCGCVVCICEGDERCRGCGAKDCGTAECVFRGVTGRIEYEDGPTYLELRAKLADAEQKISVFHELPSGCDGMEEDAFAILQTKLADANARAEALSVALTKIASMETHDDTRLWSIADHARRALDAVQATRYSLSNARAQAEAERDEAQFRIAASAMGR